MKLIKKLIQKIFFNFGYRITKIKNKKFKEFDDIYKKILNDNSIIIDVGANKGQSIERFLKFQNPVIYSFEPSSESFKILKGKFQNKNNCYLYNIALGAEKSESLFFEYNNDELNSFNMINNSDEKKKGEIKVSINTLDNFAEHNNLQGINLLKIDTQGYEENVLLGSTKLLKENKIDIIEVELILGNYYDKYTSFYNIEKILKNGSYRLIALDRRPNVFENNKLYFDAIYITKELYKKHII